MKKIIQTKFRTDPITLYLYNIKDFCEYSYGFSKNTSDKYEKGLNFCIDKICKKLLKTIKGKWEYTIIITAKNEMGIIKNYNFDILDKKEIEHE